MTTKNPFIPFKSTAWTSLAALALAGSAWATSPYDTAYGLQWNYMTGAAVAGSDVFVTASNNINGTQTAVVSDGTVFVTNRTSVATWGSGTPNGVCSGVGAISPLGKLLYGTTLTSLPGMQNPGQQYLSGVNAANNNAYIGVYGAGTQYWSGQDTSDNNRVMTFSLDSSGLASIANQRRLSKYKDAVATPRTDGLGPILPGLGLNQPGESRSNDSALQTSTLDMIIVGNSNSDFATASDWGGTAYGCFIGRYNLSTNTLTGPAKQPVVRNASIVIRGDYTRAGIDQTTGRYYGAGYPSAGGISFDPDGAGAISPLTLDAASSNAFAVAYDASHNVIYTVVWDSPTVGVTKERINAIAPTTDGTNFVFFAGETTGDMPGFIGTNDNPTTRSDSYVELRDAAGTVVWSDQFEMSSLSDAITAAEVLANGDLIVTGHKDGATAGKRDSFVRKYKKTGPAAYTEVWTNTIVNPSDPTNTINDQVQDSAFKSTGDAVYLTVQSFGQWDNTTGHVFVAGSDDLLVQKLTPGDFNANGVVDFADVQIAGTATQPGLTGVDTYDFNGDGHSTLTDTTYMITNIMDRLVGDVAQDPLVTDVDNADIGKAIGSVAASGKLYLEGDIDFDSDVDNADITAVAAAFTGAKVPGKWAAGMPPAGATLTYRASDGNIWLHANEATGGKIVSFQLENSAGTFAVANYSGPAGGSFGGSRKDVTTNVIGDTDLTLVGTGGVVSLGTVLPAGMDLVALTAYLKTAVYTGQSGSGQKSFTLVVGDYAMPTLTSIVDDQSGGPVAAGTMIAYTVTFSEDIDSSSVSAEDFDNNGTAVITIGSIAETAPTSGVFTVQVTPTTGGTLNLRIPTGAVVQDLDLNSLVVPVADNNMITVNVGGGSPEIDVNQGVDIANGGSKNFGSVTLGSNNSLVFTINNTGTSNINLTGTPLVAVSGASAADFTVIALPSTPVVGPGNTTFTVQFAPLGTLGGVRNAVLTIANNDSDEGTFTINVSGTAQTKYEAWADGALFDADTNGDGVNNGLAFLLGASGPSSVVTLPTITQSGGNLILSNFLSRKDASRGAATLYVQHSSDLGISDPWVSVPVTDAGTAASGVTFSVILADPNNTVTATISSSQATAGKLFGRLQANP